MISLEPATEADRAAIVAIVEGAGLPLAGIEQALATAVVAREDGRVVGCAAVEPYGSYGLLRSVAVLELLRGLGVGRGLVQAAEQMAAGQGIGQLYLLTETAASWFPRLGYVPVDRSAVPEPITRSAEFAEACPVSAAVLVKSL